MKELIRAFDDARDDVSIGVIIFTGQVSLLGHNSSFLVASL